MLLLWLLLFLGRNFTKGDIIPQDTVLAIERMLCVPLQFLIKYVKIKVVFTFINNYVSILFLLSRKLTVFAVL